MRQKYKLEITMIDDRQKCSGRQKRRRFFDGRTVNNKVPSKLVVGFDGCDLLRVGVLVGFVVEVVG